MGMLDFMKSWTVVKKKDYDTAKTAISELKRLDTSVRPLFEDTDILTNRNKTIYYMHRMGLANLSMWDLFYMSKHSDILQLVFNTRNKEVFRNGYMKDPVGPEATEEQLEEIENFIKSCNENGQSLTEVLKEFNMDLDWADDAYLLVAKDYYLNEDNELIGGKVTEVLRINPLTIEIMLDKQNRIGYDKEGNPAYFSLRDRSEITNEPVDKQTGIQNLRACFKVGTSSGAVYYDKTEILHKSAHNPSPTYGYSPLYAFYNKILILMSQDDYIRRYYGENKPLRDLLFVNTTNDASFKALWEKMLARKKQDPHATYPIIGSNQNGKLVEHVDLNKTLNEMQFSETRMEMRNQIGAYYGVSPVFQNDVSVSGGLNNEGLQITVTNRAIEDRQTLFNEIVLPFIFKQNMGITSYEITLNPSEEQDDMHELDRELKEYQLAEQKLKLGLKARVKDGEIVFDDGELELQQQDSFGGLGFGEEGQDPQGTPELNFDNLDPINMSKSKEVSKASKISPQEAKKWGNQMQRELKKILEKIDFKKKPSEAELQRIVDKNIKIVMGKIKAKSANRVKEIYRKELKNMSKNLKFEPRLSKQDQNAIELLKRDKAFQEAFSGLTATMAQKVKSVITEAYNKPEEFTIDKIVKKMSEEVETSDSHLRNIARTETGKISSAARINSYEKAGGKDQYLFKHIGPNDKRTTDTSKRIEARTRKGVTWDEYVKIVKEESAKDFPEWTVKDDAPLSHYQSRHTFIGIRRE